MRSVRTVLFTLVLVAVCASGAAAQDSGKVGVTMGYPASVGIIWHASDAIAIRPEFNFAGSSSDNALTTIQGIDLEGNAWSFGTGVSALFYLHKYDQLRTYVSPRVTYSHNHSTTTTNGTLVSDSTFTSTNIQFSGSFGAEYSLSSKFSAFGEVGFGFGHSSSESSSSPAKPSTDSWGTRTGVGVIFYF